MGSKQMSDSQQNTLGDGERAVVTKVRVKPTIAIGLGIYLLYLAVFFAVWTINNVDYPQIGKTIESTKLHYAMPTLIASSVVAVVLTFLGWWRITLFDKQRSGPRWAWIGVAAMFLLAIGALSRVYGESVEGMLIVWSLLGAIGVGFGEEMINRGSLLVSLRTKFTEGKVWFLTSVAFAALHLPNALFGADLGPTIAQFFFAFIVGSLLYSIRRLGGTLLLCMLLHGLWDSAVFLPGALGLNPPLIQGLIYPIAIICATAVILKNKGKTIETYQKSSISD